MYSDLMFQPTFAQSELTEGFGDLLNVYFFLETLKKSGFI